MTWFRVDDGLSTHRKVDDLGDDQALAIACWTMCGAACARDLTDGFVTEAALKRTLALWSRRDQARAVRALIRVGLWQKVDGGWLFHEWLNHQPSREKVLAERDRKARNKRDSRGKRENVTGDVTADVTDLPAVSHHGPTRPDPSVSLTRDAGKPVARGLDEKIRANVQRVLDHLGVITEHSREHRDLRALTAPMWGELALWCVSKAKATNNDPANVAALVIEGWATNERVAEKSHPLTWLVRSPGEWYLAGVEAERRGAA